MPAEASAPRGVSEKSQLRRPTVKGLIEFFPQLSSSSTAPSSRTLLNFGHCAAAYDRAECRRVPGATPPSCSAAHSPNEVYRYFGHPMER